MPTNKTNRLDAALEAFRSEIDSVEVSDVHDQPGERPSSFEGINLAAEAEVVPFESKRRPMAYALTAAAALVIVSGVAATAMMSGNDKKPAVVADRTGTTAVTSLAASTSSQKTSTSESSTTQSSAVPTTKVLETTSTIANVTPSTDVPETTTSIEVVQTTVPPNSTVATTGAPATTGSPPTTATPTTQPTTTLPPETAPQPPAWAPPAGAQPRTITVTITSLTATGQTYFDTDGYMTVRWLPECSLTGECRMDQSITVKVTALNQPTAFTVPSSESFLIGGDLGSTGCGVTFNDELLVRPGTTNSVSLQGQGVVCS